MAKATKEQIEYFQLCQTEATLEREGLMDEKLKKKIGDKKKEKKPKADNGNSKPKGKK